MKHRFHLNSVLVILLVIFAPLQLIAAGTWEKTGGPIGGLGYNIKIDPKNPEIFYVTDAFSGLQKSINSGKTWTKINNGITTRSGPTGDEVPIFSLAIDPEDSNILWVGTQNQGEVFKSIDAGESFSKKTNGIEENEGLTIRNFAIYHDDHNRVIMTGELNVGEPGDEFSKVKGVIYRTDDGGENWTKLWEGDSLARWVCINPNNTDAIVVATGIFDREAFNTSGLGAIKTTDGGETWFDANKGITGSLFMGAMAMHPDLPGTMLVATGNNNDFNKGINGGIFISEDAGNNWTKLYPSNNFNFDYKVYTASAFAPSNSNVLYAGSSEAIFVSKNFGKSWKKRTGINGAAWGPKGIRAGVPIEIQVDPKNPKTLYINNYGGGVFKSINAAKTWKNFSTGYTGANIYSISISDKKNTKILVNGRSGAFKSNNSGDSWKGLNISPVSYAEGLASAIHPRKAKIIFISDEHQGQVYKSVTAGKAWDLVFEHPGADASDANNRHGAKEIVISKSNPDTVYIGFSNDGLFSEPESEDFTNSFGVYKSINGGDSWVEANNGLEITTQNITALVVNSENENELYLGLREGGLYYSEDGANTWTQISEPILSSNGVYAIAVDFSKQEGGANTIYAAGLNTGICVSTDGGITWRQTLSTSEDQLIRSIVINPKNKSNLYAADWYSGIYESIDSGISWNLINTGLSNKAVNDLEISADGQMLYAATKGEGVFKLSL